MVLHILSGGAAQGVVRALKPEFESETGVRLEGAFGAVGLMKEKLLAGEPCDVAILTAALIDELGRGGHVLPETAAPLGRVKTGIAVRAGEAQPDVASAEGLKAALLNSRGIYFPDPEKATAGIHFINVLQRLGIDKDVASNLRPYPNGATAMRELGKSTEKGLIGCTQVTEILYTENVTLVGPLPAEFELATVYTAAVCSRAADPKGARRLVELLGGQASGQARSRGGFEF